MRLGVKARHSRRWAGLALCPEAFKIQKFMILPTNFSEEQGFLTPTKKLKRPIVEKAFNKQVEQMYSSKDTYVRYQP